MPYHFSQRQSRGIATFQKSHVFRLSIPTKTWDSPVRAKCTIIIESTCILIVRVAPTASLTAYLCLEDGSSNRNLVCFLLFILFRSPAKPDESRRSQTPANGFCRAACFYTRSILYTRDAHAYSRAHRGHTIVSKIIALPSSRWFCSRARNNPVLYTITTLISSLNVVRRVLGDAFPRKREREGGGRRRGRGEVIRPVDQILAIMIIIRSTSVEGARSTVCAKEGGEEPNFLSQTRSISLREGAAAAAAGGAKGVV